MHIIKNGNPAGDGYRMPAEFAPHQGCLMIFPQRRDSWQYGAYAARKAFAQVAMAISRFEKVTVLAGAGAYDVARAMLPAHIRVVEMESDDAWARDYLPTFVVDGRGGIRGLDFGFNAWGGLVDGLYFPWDKDNAMARKVCDLMDVDVYDMRDFILEGGSIHVDGEGTCMVTASCLLSPGRNPHLSREEIEQKLRYCLGVEKVLWLPRGIYMDETNEHVDNICCFLRPGVVALAWTEDTEDAQYAMSRACLEYLDGERDAAGRRLEVVRLPQPRPVVMTEEECQGLDGAEGQPSRSPGERLAASYVNFYFANGAVIMPAFGDPADGEAAAILAKYLPDREILSISARDILIGGGNIHCITQQIPRV